MRTLPQIRSEAISCTKCGLASGRTQVVFGVGNVESDLMVIGEAPGAQEDLLGEPFVGRSGKLLDTLIGQELGLDRNSMYIANVVKCRPPNNRNPTPDEVRSCIPYLHEQIGVIDPKVIITLGNFALQAMIQGADGVTKMRGRTYSIAGRSLVPTYHPSYALRGGAQIVAEIRSDLVRAKEIILGLG